MRKIIGFRIEIKPWQIERRAKKAGLNLKEEGFSPEAVEALITKARQSVVPAVLYDTFPGATPELSKLSPLPGLAFSLILATAGDPLHRFVETLRGEGPAMGTVASLIEDAALDEVLRFTTGLIAEDAGREACALSPLSPLADEESLRAVLSKLDGSKISVSLTGGRLQPRPSRAASLAWISKSKAKGKTS